MIAYPGITTDCNRVKCREGSLALYWLCQAGFAFKTSAGQIVYIDPYLSDVVERRASASSA